MYPLEIVNPMKKELTDAGFKELLTTEEVDETFKQDGTTLVVINSVCGCGASTARPGVLRAIENASKKPDHLVTSFAGVDKEAVAQARAYFAPYPPSSPSIALLKDGKLVHMIERHMIDGKSSEMIEANLVQAFEAFCE